MKDSALLDLRRQVMRCEVCSEEVPIPFGVVQWVTDVITAFSKAHRSCKRKRLDGDNRLTWFSTPVKEPTDATTGGGRDAAESDED